MVIGRIVHYALDAVLLSTVVAGVRRSSGFTSVFFVVVVVVVDMILRVALDLISLAYPTRLCLV